MCKWIAEFPGVWKYESGELPVTLTGLAGVEPASYLKELPETELPERVQCNVFNGNTVLRIPLEKGEQVFGCGLLFHHVISKNAVYHLRMDHSAGVDNGRTHAPVPFLATDKGFGLFCNTPDPVTISVGTTQRMEDKAKIVEHDRGTDSGWNCYNEPFYLEIAVESESVQFVLFQGTDLKDCTARFNLFCGGGCLPPKWGLGVWHRTNMTMNSQEVRQVVNDYREHHFPLSVLGLEPGWQSASYPCSYEWSEKKFPDYRELIREMKDRGIRINLWENPYLSQKSPLYEKLRPFSGSHLVWGGIVPDYALKTVRETIQEHFLKTHVEPGISGYKLDESDGYDCWLWPDYAEFPSGLKGIAYRSVCGLLFQRITTEIFHRRNERTWGLTRSSNGGGVSFPYVIYNDRYDYEEFLTGLCSCGVTGTLWCPELRGGKNPKEWLRRFQLAAISPLLLINAWATQATPWMFPEVETQIRDAISLREKLLPYLYSAFAKYRFKGIPPYRPVFMDYGTFLENQTRKGKLDSTENPYELAPSRDIRDQFIFGDTLMAAPLPLEKDSRLAVFPKGKWFDFYTGELVSDGGVAEIRRSPCDPMPIFAPDGAVIPFLENDQISVLKYGTKEGSFDLYDDDGCSYAFEQGECRWKNLNQREK